MGPVGGSRGRRPLGEGRHRCQRHPPGVDPLRAEPVGQDQGLDLALEDPGAAAYPRGAIRAADLPALRDRVARIPDLKKMVGSPQRRFFTYLAAPDPANGAQLIRDEHSGDANWMGILPKLRTSVGHYLDREGDMGSHTFMHHGNSNVGGAAPLFDVAMSVPEMTPTSAARPWRLYAFCIYKISEPDWLAYGAGFHLGNPNMPTMSLSLLGMAAALIPEHPISAEWMIRSLTGTLAMLRDFVAPGGAWRECPHYQLDGGMAGILHAAPAFRNAGFLDLCQNRNFKATMLYNLQLLTPVDPRFGIRTVPAIGNGTHETTSLYGRMAAGTAASDPAYSRWMQWGWRAVGKIYMYANDEMVCNEDLPAAPPDLSSRHFPGFGSVSGESNLDAPGEALLSLPAASTGKTLVVKTGDREERTSLVRDGQAVKMALPAGRCAFRWE